MKKIVNIDKLGRHDIDTNRLQEVALLLLKTLYNRADEDLSETMERGGTDESERKDRHRRALLKNVYELMKEIPPRGEDWRHILV